MSNSISNTQRALFFSALGVGAIITGAALISLLAGNILSTTGHASAASTGLESYGQWVAVGGAGSLFLTLGVSKIVLAHAARKKNTLPLTTDM